MSDVAQVGGRERSPAEHRQTGMRYAVHWSIH